MTLYYQSESELIEYIKDIFDAPNIGDDCAILSLPSKIVMSSDICMEGIDFSLSTFGPADIGYKSLAINISDIFAMGAIPLGFSMCLTLPPSLSMEYINTMLCSMSSLAKVYSLILSGGDICKGDMLSISITIWGFAQNPIMRHNAQIGDCIFYISREPQILGLARTGYLALEKNLLEYSRSIAFQKNPSLLLTTDIIILQQYSNFLSLMDISDGLSQDIPRLLGNTLGAEIFLEKDILHSEIHTWSTANTISPYEHAFWGGEEYCLLATGKEEIFIDLKKELPCTLLGHVTNSGKIYCNNLLYPHKGFDHFT
ncbi:MAG: thiamine-phosphate kinase [Desulfovibrionaceae bacterium]